MTDRATQTIEAFERKYDEFTDAFREALSDKVGDTVDTYLLTFREPKAYADCRHFGQVLADSLTLWAATEGWLILPEVHTASPEVQAQRALDRQAAKQAAPAPLTNPVRRIDTGAYL